MKVYDRLKNGTLDEARYAVSMIVGRDTRELDGRGRDKGCCGDRGRKCFRRRDSTHALYGNRRSVAECFFTRESIPWIPCLDIRMINIFILAVLRGKAG